MSTEYEEEHNEHDEHVHNHEEHMHEHNHEHHHDEHEAHEHEHHHEHHHHDEHEEHEHEHCSCEHENHDGHNHEEHEHHHHHDECGCGHSHGHHHHHEHEHDACGCGHSHGHSHSHGENDDDDEKELSVKAIIVAAILFVLGIITEHLPLNIWFAGLTSALPFELSKTVSLIFFLISYLICGKDLVISALYNVTHGNLMDEQFLMAVSSIGAMILGKFEEATAIMILYQVGEKFEDYAVDKSRDSIEEISKLRPDHALLKIAETNGSLSSSNVSSENIDSSSAKLISVSPEEVKVGSIIVVKPGDRIPIDGIIENGESFIDTSALTGESIPVKVTKGNEVLAGSINKQGVLEIRTTRQVQDSALSRILELVENATENKTKSEKFVTRFAKVYTPIVVTAACILAVLPPVITGFINGNWSWDANWSGWVYRALMFLVVSCPCAIVISIPLSFCGGITANASRGILIKGSTYLEALAKTKTAVFDKTGTLTKGNFVVTHIHATDPSITENELLALATHTEMLSTHPISASLKKAHHGTCCDNVSIKNVEEIAGKGIKADVDGKNVLAGNTKLMDAFNIQYDECPEHQDGTIVHVACNGKYAGHIVIADEIKEDSELAVKNLKAAGVENIVMLTGDNERMAQAVAKKIGITKAFGQLLSGDKLSKVEEMLAELNRDGKKRGTLIFTGDGINDAPVLARADAGIAMGAMGSDAAVEAADIIIMEDKPSKIAEGIKISRKTLRIVYENLIGSLSIKGAILILSAAGISNMWVAVFGDVGVTILAVLNSLRLLRKN